MSIMGLTHTTPYTTIHQVSLHRSQKNLIVAHHPHPSASPSDDLNTHVTWQLAPSSLDKATALDGLEISKDPRSLQRS